VFATTRRRVQVFRRGTAKQNHGVAVLLYRPGFPKVVKLWGTPFSVGLTIKLCQHQNRTAQFTGEPLQVKDNGVDLLFAIPFPQFQGRQHDLRVVHDQQIKGPTPLQRGFSGHPPDLRCCRGLSVDSHAPVPEFNSGVTQMFPMLGIQVTPHDPPTGDLRVHLKEPLRHLQCIHFSRDVQYRFARFGHVAGDTDGHGGLAN